MSEVSSDLLANFSKTFITATRSSLYSSDDTLAPINLASRYRCVSDVGPLTLASQVRRDSDVGPLTLASQVRCDSEGSVSEEDYDPPFPDVILELMEETKSMQYAWLLAPTRAYFAEKAENLWIPQLRSSLAGDEDLEESESKETEQPLFDCWHSVEEYYLKCKWMPPLRIIDGVYDANPFSWAGAHKLPLHRLTHMHQKLHTILEKPGTHEHMYVPHSLCEIAAVTRTAWDACKIIDPFFFFQWGFAKRLQTPCVTFNDDRSAKIDICLPRVFFESKGMHWPKSKRIRFYRRTLSTKTVKALWKQGYTNHEPPPYTDAALERLWRTKDDVCKDRLEDELKRVINEKANYYRVIMCFSIIYWFSYACVFEYHGVPAERCPMLVVSCDGTTEGLNFKQVFSEETRIAGAWKFSGAERLLDEDDNFCRKDPAAGK